MSFSDPFTRALKLADYLNDGGLITTRYIRETFRVSRATAKRDMVMIEASYPVTVEQRSNADQQEGGVPYHFQVIYLSRGARA